MTNWVVTCLLESTTVQKCSAWIIMQAPAVATVNGWQIDSLIRDDTVLWNCDDYRSDVSLYNSLQQGISFWARADNIFIAT